MRPTHHLTLVCAQCGRAAAEITLLPAEVEGRAVWAKGDRLERMDFMGQVTRFGPYDDLLRFFELLRRGDFEAVRGADADFIGFYCSACRRIYCEHCWHLGPPQFEDGFYDCTFGTCPQGHEQVVDD